MKSFIMGMCESEDATEFFFLTDPLLKIIFLTNTSNSGSEVRNL